MKFRFSCRKHEIDLEGFPLWALTSDDPDIFIISLKGFACVGGIDDVRCGEENWVVEIDNDGKSIG